MDQSAYYIGLNINETAVGWAVADSSYHLLRANGKALWGVRVFDRADSAEERRAFRHARRKRARRAQRIQLLQSLFSDEIGKVDPAFFQRLRESKFDAADKQGVQGPFALFADPGYTDIEFHQQYPTIYHLRKKLLTEAHPFDVRLVYLAIHHLFKHRGHFRSAVSVSGEVPSFSSALSAVNACLEASLLSPVAIKDEPAFAAALQDASLGKATKKKLLLQYGGVSRQDTIAYAFVELLAGNKVDIRIFYPHLDLKAAKISLADLQDDSSAEAVYTMLGPQSGLLQRIKAVADWAALANLLNGQQYLSFVKVAQYEKHKSDLALLKREVRDALPHLYHEIFHLDLDQLCNYPAYSGHQSSGKRCDYKQFRSFLSNRLKEISLPSANVDKILRELDQGIFLPLQHTAENQLVPHQLLRHELLDILHRAEGYLPFLSRTDAAGLTISEKIVSIFDFTIPYFVGPPNTSSPYSWAVRKNEKLFPWNFDQVVDLSTTAERFMQMRTAKCPYLNCDILPKDSLLYSEFVVLETLNQIRINGNRLSPESKQRIFQEFFLKRKQVTRDGFVKYLTTSGISRSTDDISGLPADFCACLRSHIVFQPILAKTNNPDLVEWLIRHIVLFGNDKKLLSGLIRRSYGDILTEDEIQYICRQSFSGWGSLSREFLTEIYHTDAVTGNAMSIIDAMRHTGYTLKELLSGPFTFASAIQAYNQSHRFSVSGRALDPLLDDAHALPAAKRAITQAVSLIDEIVTIMKKQPPARIFITSSSENDRYSSPVVRKNFLLDRYKSCGPDVFSLSSALALEHPNSLRDEKRYLFYAQLGRCMYSGDAISPGLLDDDQHYIIASIYPIDDASDNHIYNHVLIKRSMACHSHAYPLSPDLQDRQTSLWKSLLDHGLISHEKFERLVRNTPLTPQELSVRATQRLSPVSHLSQLALTILNLRYNGLSQASYVSGKSVQSLRRYAGRVLPVSACVDFGEYTAVTPHDYAKTAYLCIVPGALLSASQPPEPLHCLLQDYPSHDDELYGQPIREIWNAGPNGSVKTLWSSMLRNNILFTRRAYENHGSLYDQSLLPKGKGQAPIKSCDPRMTIDKFGGYNKIKGSYFCFVEHQAGEKRIRSLETVYFMYERIYQKDPAAYCKEILGLQQPHVLIRCIKMDSLFSYDGFRMHISGRSGGGKQIVYKNANPLILSAAQKHYMNQILLFLENSSGIKLSRQYADQFHITPEENLLLYQSFEQKMSGFYGRMYSAPAKALCKGAPLFSSLGIVEQCKILSQILNLFACRPASVDLSAIGGSRNGGRLLTNNAFPTACGHAINLVFQSVTGVFERRMDLLRICGSQIPLENQHKT